MDARVPDRAIEIETARPAPRRRGKLVVLAFSLILAAAGAFGWWQYQARYPSTDDAYVQAHIVQIAARISGPLVELAVHNDQRVNKGDLLFAIDPAPFEAAVHEAEAALDQARQSARAAAAAIEAARARVDQVKAAVENAQSTYARVAQLRKRGDSTQAALDDALAALDQGKANQAAALASLEQARQTLGEGGEENAGVRAAAAALERARLNLSYTRVIAPSDGFISNLTTRPGQMVQAGASMFALVEDSSWWVDANFKETDLTRIRPGQPASVQVDMYPDRSINGVVESIGAGSGATFSLLPPENATGNWVKVTQRFTVRIKLIDHLHEVDRPLRVGASALITVDTTAGRPHN